MKWVEDVVEEEHGTEIAELDAEEGTEAEERGAEESDTIGKEGKDGNDKETVEVGTRCRGKINRRCGRLPGLANKPRYMEA